MTSTLTRRGLVAAAPAAIVGATVPALAAEHPDAALLALRSRWKATLAAFDETFPPLEAAERICWELQPNLPDRKTFTGTIAENEAAHQKVVAEIEQLEIETGVKAAEDAQGEACTANWKVAEQIFDHLARTIDGIRLKLEVLEALAGVDLRKFEAQLKSDLLAMVGIHDA